MALVHTCAAMLAWLLWLREQGSLPDWPTSAASAMAVWVGEEAARAAVRICAAAARAALTHLLMSRGRQTVRDRFFGDVIPSGSYD